MNSLEKLLVVVVASAGSLASAQAAVEQARSAETIPAMRVAVLNPVVNSVGFPAEASFRVASAAAVRHAAADTGIRSTHASNVVAVASPGGAVAPRTGRAGAEFRSPAPTTPEPAEWMQLLCGLVIAGFIARRRTSLMAS